MEDFRAKEIEERDWKAIRKEQMAAKKRDRKLRRMNAMDINMLNNEDRGEFFEQGDNWGYAIIDKLKIVILLQTHFYTYIFQIFPDIN